MRQRVNSDATTNRTLSPLKSTLTLSQRRKSSDAASEESVKSKVSIQLKLGQPLKIIAIPIIKSTSNSEAMFEIIGFYQHQSL